MMIEGTPDFDAYRRRKQAQADQELGELMATFHDWASYHVNLREKVRAKHIFSEIVSLPKEIIDGSPWEKVFEDWFLFDYVTIIGTRNVDMFLKKEATKLKPAQTQLGAIILTAGLEPYRILKKKGNMMEAVKTDNGQTKQFKTVDRSVTSEYFVCRSIQCGYKDRMISPYIPIDPPQEEIKKWRQELADREKDNQQFRFIKEYGIRWLRFAYI